MMEFSEFAGKIEELNGIAKENKFPLLVSTYSEKRVVISSVSNTLEEFDNLLENFLFALAKHMGKKGLLDDFILHTLAIVVRTSGELAGVHDTIETLRVAIEVLEEQQKEEVSEQK